MSSGRSRRFLWLSLAVLALLAGCFRVEQPWNVLIVSLDTTRGDRFGSTGHEAAYTPNFDAFSARAVQFDNAISAVPVTFPSHTTIMSGTYPVFHGVHDNDGYYLDDEVTTLAEILGGEGFTTAAFLASFPLDSQFNLDQGFDTYDDDFQADWTETELRARTPLSFGFLERTADRVNRSVERWLAGHASERFFLWVHYFDPHQAYEPPAPYDSQFAGSLYDGEIAFMDEHFGALLGLLANQQLLERTLIVVVGDHGEGLNQHGEPTHASLLYDATMRVPLMIAAPGERFEAGSRVAPQVRTLDVAPTILDLLGLPPGPEMQGQSLVPLLKDPERPWASEALLETYFSRFHYNWAPIRALRTDQWKLIQAPKPELYDMQADPQELYNLSSRQPEKVAELSDRLARLARSVSSPRLDRSVAVETDSETREKLMALGYVAGSASNDLRAAPFPAPEELAELPNPIDKALTLTFINAATERIRTRNFEQAARLAREGLVMDPDNPRLHGFLAQALGQLGLYDEALAEAKKMQATQGDLPWSYAVEGRIHLARGDLEAALSAFKRVIELTPQEIETLKIVARIHANLERHDEAIAHLEAIVALDEGDWDVYVALGKSHALSDRWEEARQAFQSALDLNPYSPVVLYDIAVFYRHVGDAEFSRRMFESVLKVAPNHVGARVQLAELMLAGEQAEDEAQAARELLERVIELAPQGSWAERAQQLLDE